MTQSNNSNAAIETLHDDALIEVVGGWGGGWNRGGHCGGYRPSYGGHNDYNRGCNEFKGEPEREEKSFKQNDNHGGGKFGGNGKGWGCGW